MRILNDGRGVLVRLKKFQCGLKTCDLLDDQRPPRRSVAVRTGSSDRGRPADVNPPTEADLLLHGSLGVVVRRSHLAPTEGPRPKSRVQTEQDHEQEHSKRSHTDPFRIIWYMYLVRPPGRSVTGLSRVHYMGFIRSDPSRLSSFYMELWFP